LHSLICGCKGTNIIRYGDISTKWVSTEYRNIQFHVDIVTFEIATKKSNIKSLSSLLENYTKLVQKGFINTFCVLENSSSMFVVKICVITAKRQYHKTYWIGAKIVGIW
jgi:hypothetical protein